jgi:hypothetical protein
MLFNLQVFNKLFNIFDLFFSLKKDFDLVSSINFNLTLPLPIVSKVLINFIVHVCDLNYSAIGLKIDVLDFDTMI